ncbi:uncharacterized protein Dmoj_GI16906 [Drosophila mojavensis]|uniref:F-box domain-containing protein n=2 Tax=Drosophila mojavensis TaxID=7230 RepID=B4KI05_DROMO|nr:uncharacterized protein Dmoj_GI16906 [Drosophila mojavensis]
MIENINDDCQLIIINYLDYQSQYFLWASSKFFAPRLHRNVSDVLQRKSSHVLDYKYMFLKNSGHNSNKLEDAFLSTICSTVQHMELKSVTMKHLQHLMLHSFPCIRSLEYKLDKVDGCEYSRALKLLVDRFPGITSFKPFGPVNCGIMEKWKFLEELESNKRSVLDKGVSLHTFQQLEHLTVNMHFLRTASIVSVLNLPKLRTFSFSTESPQNRALLPKILKQRPEDICKLTFRFIDWTWSLESLLLLKNLRQLTLIEDFFKRGHFQRLVSNLPVLEQVNMIGGQFWHYEMDLWEAVASCSSLKVLNFSNTLIEDDFYDSNRHFMYQALNNRSQPLLMHCYNTGQDLRDPAEYQYLISKHFNHPNLIVSFEKLPVEEIPFQYTKIEFAQT